MQQKMEQLTTQLDDERAEFDKQLGAHMAQQTEKETAALSTQLKMQKEIERLTYKNTELQKDADRRSISKTDLENQLDAKEDLIAELEESLEQAKFKIQSILEKVN